MDSNKNQDEAKNREINKTHLNGEAESPQNIVSHPDNERLEGVLSADEILLLEQGGLTLEDAIRAIESSEE
jgi:hypothetical protein